MKNLKQWGILLGTITLLVAGCLVLPVWCSNKYGSIIPDEEDHYEADPRDKVKTDTIYTQDSTFVISTKIDTAFKTPEEKQLK